MALIRALPAEYAALQQTLLGNSLTLRKLQEMFIALKNQSGMSTPISVLSNVASTSSCAFCGRSGHSEECFSKCDARTKAKEKAYHSQIPKHNENASEAQDTPQKSASAATVGCASALPSLSECNSCLLSFAAAHAPLPLVSLLLTPSHLHMPRQLAYSLFCWAGVSGV